MSPMASVSTLTLSLLATVAVAAATSAGYGYGEQPAMQHHQPSPCCKASELDAIRDRCKGAKELLKKRDECCKELGERPPRDVRGGCVCGPVLSVVGAAEPLQEACSGSIPMPCNGFVRDTTINGLECTGDDGATVVKCRDMVRALPGLKETCLCELAHREDVPGGCFAEAVAELGIRPGDVVDKHKCPPRN